MPNDLVTVELYSLPLLTRAYASGRLRPLDVVDAVIERIAQVDRPEAWIHRVPDAALHARAKALESRLAEEGDAVFVRMPLFGVPFAVKDNIDVAGIPTTAACAPFSY